MKRTSTVWLIYVFSLVVMTAAMSWVTHRTLRMEHEEKLTALRAENERLALWRMESVLLPFVSSESSRDYSHWGSRGWANTLLTARGEIIDSSSPADLYFTVRFGSPYVSEYFRCDSTGQFVTRESTSSNWNGDTGPEIDEAVTAAPRAEAEGTTATRLASLDTDSARSTLFALTRKAREACPISTTVRSPTMEFSEFSNPDATANAAANQSEAENEALNQQAAPSQSLDLGPQQQLARNTDEFRHRMNNTGKGNTNFISQTALANGLFGMNASSRLYRDGAGPMTAFWLDEELILARHVSAASWEAVEGCVLDQETIHEAILTSIRDMFPEAKLEPVQPDEADNPLALASLPLKLVPGPMPVEAAREWTPMSTSLSIAWGWLALSALAIGVLLFGVVRLSERRAAFVSAVTHELRTPLTTFRLYSDLLVDRANLTEEKHEAYAKTLQSESERLGHLVENVLSWSRLDQTSGPEFIEDVSWEDQLKRSQPALQRRAAQAGMSLEVLPGETSSEGQAPPIHFRANSTAVDQILFNLVDNSCKYASQTEDQRIQISAEKSDGDVRLRVRDFGPGLCPKALATLFQPFSKSATAAAKSAPGVGLGLSLCRRLARSMNGELTHIADPRGGTTIELRLTASAA